MEKNEGSRSDHFQAGSHGGGKATIRGLRVTVGTIVGLIAAGRTKDAILKLYPYLEPEDIDQALAYAAWRVEEIDIPVTV